MHVFQEIETKLTKNNQIGNIGEMYRNKKF